MSQGIVQKLWRRAQGLIPVEGFCFDRPLVLFQSDDWGRCGVRDREGLEQLRAAGIALGERAYDLYSLETADDVGATAGMLLRHRDSGGRPPRLAMNFVVANLDFAQMDSEFRGPLCFRPLAEGLPAGWNRPGLMESYQQGILRGVFLPALHGTSHFCRHAIERYCGQDSERGQLLRTWWRAGTPYIHWRMPWIGYEYWDPEQAEDDRFLAAEVQRALIGEAVGWFAKLFSRLPHSACAPGYRANEDTHQAWAQHGIRVAQNGPGTPTAPHFDRHRVLQIARNVEFEPATDANFSVEHALARAERCFEQGLPAIVSVHSINFHSTLRDFRSRTLQALDKFLSALEAKHADLVYLDDEDLYDLIVKGRHEAQDGTGVRVMRKRISTRAGNPAQELG